MVAFAFGLLHWFGFAGALSEVGLPQAAIPLALLFLNLGVEPLRRGGGSRAVGGTPSSFERHGWAELLPPYAIGTTAMFWLMQRLIAFGGR